MKKKKLHTDFEEAVAFVNSYTQPMPPDLLLKLYAYYKIAKNDYDSPSGEMPLIDAFKANALIQARNLSHEQAMRAYVKLVKVELRDA